MRIFIIYLLFITQVFGQAGGIQIQEQGVSNYQIQPSVPTTVPVAGKKYLFNDNGIFSTKDSASNVQRINNNQFNILTNGDIEQGLGGFAGIGTLNTATPLFGLNSLALDTTAINDMAETLPFLMKPGFNGQNCMGQFTISPTDGNLSASVINADGTTVVTQVIAASTNNQTIHMAFKCPDSTATVNQRTLKVRVFQSGANAAAVNLDSFYLGLFSADRLSVVEGSQWYYFTANADINGNFTFPAPTASTNDKTLFTYAGTTLTVLKPININILAFGLLNNGGGTETGTSDIVCNISGVTRTIHMNFYVGVGQQATPNNTNLLLNANDTCTITLSRNTSALASHTVNITATPLPSLASLVASPNLPAGFWGSKVWSPRNCAWQSSAAAWADFPLVAGCATGGQVFGGKALADAANDGQLPQIRLSSLPKGRYTIVLNSAFYSTPGAPAFRIIGSDGLTSSSSSGQTNAGNYSSGFGMSLDFNNTADKTDYTLRVQQQVNPAATTSIYPFYSGLSISVYSYPDLSSPYNQSIIAALPPQVSNSSEKSWRTESCYITNNGTAAMASSSCGTFIQSVARTTPGYVTINFISGIWTQVPICTLVSYATNGDCHIFNSPVISTTQAILHCYNPTGAADVDVPMMVNCQGIQ